MRLYDARDDGARRADGVDTLVQSTRENEPRTVEPFMLVGG
jgi:hypothetical protein